LFDVRQRHNDPQLVREQRLALSRDAKYLALSNRYTLTFAADTQRP
jgi:hypothetical protein